MKHEFVTYELAVKLKKLGFDEPCFFAFDNCSTPMRCSDLRTNEQKFEGVNYNSSTYTSQPTFSQAFRWFREKYNIQSEVVYVKPSSTDPEENYMCKIDEALLWVVTNTYEEAELACLTKLIEIVEQQKTE